MSELRRIFVLSLVPLVVMACALLVSCGGDEEEPPTSLEDADGLAFFYVDRLKTPALVVYKSGETLTLLSDDGGSTISGAVFGFPNTAPLLVEGGSDGLPSRAYVDGYTFIFENWRSDTVDVGVVDPSGAAEVFQDVDRPEGSVAAPMLLQDADSPESAIKAGQILISAGACVISGVAAILSGGVAIPIALIACSKFLLKATVMVLEEKAPDSPWTEGLEVADTALAAAGCTIPDPLSAADCVDVVLTITGVVITEAGEAREAGPRTLQELKDSVAPDNGTSGSFESEGIVFLPVTPGGSIDIRGTSFDVDAFYIAKHETTNAQYEAFVQSGDGFDNPAWWTDMPAAWTPPRRGLDARRNPLPDAPRDNVSWYQAVAFTRWLNARMA